MNENIIYGWRNILPPTQPVPSFMDMCRAMQNRTMITITGAWHGPITGLINRIEAEDGSGKCWNVTISYGIHTSTVFVRTA